MNPKNFNSILSEKLLNLPHIQYVNLNISYGNLGKD